ncbi:MAG: hypothetical protein ACO3LE_10375, partial [Bdellovibrionota bacterium]
VMRGGFYLLFVSLFFGLAPSSAYSMCADVLAKILKGVQAGPATLPEAPPTEPMRIPTAPPAPTPDKPKRRIPIPAPEGPPRQIPEKPLEDPKDINPEILYSTDARASAFWDRMPVGLRRVMIEGMRAEREKLSAHMEQKYRVVSVGRLLQAVSALEREIAEIEGSHKKEILSVIRELMEKRYGDTVQGLNIQITNERPTPQSPAGTNGQSVPELPKNLDDGMIYRTELRNLWLQGEGWIGMKEFVYEYAPQLDAIQPGLAEKYQELDRLYRFGQLAQLELIPTPEVIDRTPKDMISAGREIVTTHFDVVEEADGSKAVEVREVRGVAVGRNAWAAVHEGRKAASQMVTPNEGAYRFLMPPERRAALDEATNSARAEIRQGVFGPAVVVALRKRIEMAVERSFNDTDFYQVMDAYFSLPPGVFQAATEILFRSEFENSSESKKELRELFESYDVF